MLVFLIPIQIAGVRRGWRFLLLTAVLTLAFFTGYCLYQFLSTPDRSGMAAMELLIGLFVPAAGLIAGLLIVNLPGLSGSRLLFRLLAATLAMGAVATPALLLLPRLPSFTAAENSIFTQIADTARTLFGESSPVTVEVLKAIYVPVLISVFLPMYFSILSFNCWAGITAGRRTLPAAGENTPSVARLSSFRVPGWLLWPSIVAVAALGADRVFSLARLGLTPVSYAITNIALMALMLYGLQGLGIIRFVFQKYRLPGILWALLLVTVLLLLVYPPTNIILVFGLPAFGVSETWIRYRIPAEPVADDE